MRPHCRHSIRERGWKRWLDRAAVVWIVCAPLLVLTAGWFGLRPGTAPPDSAPGEQAAADAPSEVPIQYRFPQGVEPSALPAESRQSEPWRTAAVRRP